MKIKRDEKTKTYYFRIDVGIDPKTKKRKQKYRSGFKTKKDALAEAMRIKTQVMEGTYFKPSIEKFEHYINRWFSSIYKPSVEITTAEARRYVIDQQILPYFKEMSLNDIDPYTIDSFYEEKREEGFSGAYIKVMHHLLNRAFKKAVQWKLIKENPVNGATPPKVKRSKKKAPWTKEEFRRFLEVVINEGTAAPYVIASFTGTRRGETLGLCWEDVDFNRESLHIQRSLSRTKEKGLIFTDLKTSGSDRLIAVSPFVMDVLKKHREQQNEQKSKLRFLYQDNDLITCTPTGTPLDPRNLLRQYYSLIEKAQVPKISFHDLRHLHATMLLRMNVHPKIVADRLGHSRIQVTLDTYSHGSDELQRDAAMQYEEELFRN